MAALWEDEHDSDSLNRLSAQSYPPTGPEYAMPPSSFLLLPHRPIGDQICHHKPIPPCLLAHDCRVSEGGSGPGEGNTSCECIFC